jgi:hypothetical protein
MGMRPFPGAYATGLIHAALRAEPNDISPELGKREAHGPGPS